MIGIILASHSNLSKGVRDAMNCIMGEQDKVKALSLNVADDINKFAPLIAETVDEMDNGEGVLIFTDLLGGSPCNQSGKLLTSKNVKIVTGLNLPMLFAAIEARSQGMDLNSTAQYSIESAINGIQNLETVVTMNKNKKGGN